MQRYVGGKKSASNDWHRIIYAQVLAFICLLLRLQALEVSDYLVHHAEHTVARKRLSVLVNELRFRPFGKLRRNTYRAFSVSFLSSSITSLLK